MKKRTDGCAACHAPLGTDEPLAWTWARQRIHEACMPIWAFSERGRRVLGDWIAEPVRLLLDRHGGQLCSSCLALALHLSLEEARSVVEITAALPGFRLLPVSCETCGRSTLSLCTVPVPDAAEKCAHCSRRLRDPAAAVIIDGEWFHRSCSQVVGARDRIRSSRATGRAAWAQLERAHARLTPRSPTE
jgi:hypothetical protein